MIFIRLKRCVQLQSLRRIDWIDGDLKMNKNTEFKFVKTRFIFGTETGREVASLEWAGIRGEEKWLVLNAWDRKFPAFAGKKFGTLKTRPGTQTSNLNTKLFCF